MASWLDQWRGKSVREPICRCYHTLELHDLTEFGLQGMLGIYGTQYPVWKFECRGLDASTQRLQKLPCLCTSFRPRA